jgi:hypothetical protein
MDCVAVISPEWKGHSVRITTSLEEVHTALLGTTTPMGNPSSVFLFNRCVTLSSNYTHRWSVW